jgi:hypothetical protein
MIYMIRPAPAPTKREPLPPMFRRFSGKNGYSDVLSVSLPLIVSMAR